ncbi:hypothetical protein [Nocardiopsis alborubida]|uniref:Uncharacterized protein n=1 Tax=Nocardiopsis alborubida TaxID=146802 RepID=A0A7X6MJD3_9ACTN|nr:hypothetical protein [Nocardiopsis alborubida]NKZ00546.1 hypothetical protein [Nocardiopsis alborubida]
MGNIALTDVTVDGTAERGRVAERIRPEAAVLVGRRIRSPRSDAVDFLWAVTVPRTGG